MCVCVADADTTMEWFYIVLLMWHQGNPNALMFGPGDDSTDRPDELKEQIDGVVCW